MTGLSIFDSLMKDAPIMFGNVQRKFPLYNLFKFEDGSYEIQLAVAGFAKEDLSVTREGHALKITGMKQSREINATTVVQEITSMSFCKTFTITPDSEVSDIKYENGLLSLKVSKPHKESVTVLQIT